MSNHQTKFSVSQDVKAQNIQDTIPQEVIRVYPYEFVNANNGRNFISPMSISIAHINQTNILNNLKKDLNGIGYFEMFSGLTSKGILDFSSQTSIISKTLKEEVRFTCLTNWYYKTTLDKVKIGVVEMIPSMFVIGEPYDEKKYREGKQTVFIPSSVIEAKSGKFSVIDDINPEGLYEFNLVNITTIESQFPNCRIIPTLKSIATHDVVNNKGNSGITIEFEHHMLLQSVKAKGTLVEVDANGNEFGKKEFGNIDFISDEKLAPFKMTPVSTDNKLTLYADWFDYDTVLPFVYIEKFRGGITLSNRSLNLSNDDWKLISDMVLVSYLYASEFQDVPVLTSGTEAGKLDPNYYIGYAKIQVSKLAGKDPIKTVDGLYEKHIRNHPTFMTDTNRFQLVQGIINALSRYINSSHTIGKGNNAYGWAYLPWYLEPYSGTGIRTAKTDSGFKSKGDGKYIILEPTVKFQAKTLYFHDKFSGDIPVKGKNSLILPSNINISNVKLLQTDRKLTLPELPFQIKAINKLPLPGDINTKSSQDLSYMFYLPVKNQTTFEDFMLNTLSTHTSITKPTDVTVQIPPQKGGHIWSQQQANAYILQKTGGNGTIKQAPLRSVVTSDWIKGRLKYNFQKHGGDGFMEPDKEYSSLKYNGHLVFQENRSSLRVDFPYLSRKLEKYLGFDNGGVADMRDVNGETEAKEDGTGYYDHTWDFWYKTKHSEWTPAIVTVQPGSTVHTYSFQGRQILFDKNEWEEFIRKFNIIPTGFTQYDFKEKKGQKIKKLDEITIASLWGNSLKLHFGLQGNEVLEIPLFNKDDETISKQKIIFT